MEWYEETIDYYNVFSTRKGNTSQVNDEKAEVFFDAFYREYGILPNSIPLPHEMARKMILKTSPCLFYKHVKIKKSSYRIDYT